MNGNASSLKGNVCNYYRWNLDVFSIEKGKKILELGCGPGLNFNAIMAYSPTLYVATDYSQVYLDEISKLFQGRQNCKTCYLDLMKKNYSEILQENYFDYLLCFDVLEHLEDDELALKNINQLMKQNHSRFLLIKVPALPGIYGQNDAAIGHYRRYTIPSLKSVLSRSLFQVHSIRYQNIVGVIPWYVIGTVLKRKLAVSNGEGKIFERLVPFLQWIEGIIPPPLGLSICCICTPSK